MRLQTLVDYPGTRGECRRYGIAGTCDKTQPCSNCRKREPGACMRLRQANRNPSEKFHSEVHSPRGRSGDCYFLIPSNSASNNVLFEMESLLATIQHAATPPFTIAASAFLILRRSNRSCGLPSLSSRSYSLMRFNAHLFLHEH